MLSTRHGFRPSKISTACRTVLTLCLFSNIRPVPQCRASEGMWDGDASLLPVLFAWKAGPCEAGGAAESPRQEREGCDRENAETKTNECG